MKKTGLGAVLAPLLICLPCLVVVIGAAGGVALASSAAAWLAGNAIIAVFGIAAAVALGVAIVAHWRRRVAACEIDPSLSENHEAPRKVR